MTYQHEWSPTDFAEEPKKEAEAVVDSVFGAITKALKEGDRVNLAGFGTFTVVDKPSRKGRNPKTGEEIDIAAKKVGRGSPIKRPLSREKTSPAARKSIFFLQSLHLIELPQGLQRLYPC